MAGFEPSTNFYVKMKTDKSSQGHLFIKMLLHLLKAKEVYDVTYIWVKIMLMFGAKYVPAKKTTESFQNYNNNNNGVRTEKSTNQFIYCIY